MKIYVVFCICFLIQNWQKFGLNWDVLIMFVLEMIYGQNWQHVSMICNCFRIKTCSRLIQLRGLQKNWRDLNLWRCRDCRLFHVRSYRFFQAFQRRQLNHGCICFLEGASLQFKSLVLQVVIFLRTPLFVIVWVLCLMRLSTDFREKFALDGLQLLCLIV